MRDAQTFLTRLQAFFPGSAMAQSEKREGAEGLWTLRGAQGWALYLRSDLDLDTDGPKQSGIRYDQYHQDETALRYKDGMSVSSHLIPYVVIPGQWSTGIKLGDYCLVQYKDKITSAIVADIGPRTKIGEGSIALHDMLGFDRVKGDKIVDVGITSGVRTVFFPGSGDGKCHTFEVINQAAWDAWEALIGAA